MGPHGLSCDSLALSLLPPPQFVLENSSREDKHECPFARSSIQLTVLLCELLRVGEPCEWDWAVCPGTGDGRAERARGFTYFLPEPLLPPCSRLRNGPGLFTHVLQPRPELP